MASTGDVEAVFELVRARYPLAPLIVVGASFGSALVANWCVRRPAAAASCNIELMLLYAYGHSVEQTVWAADHDVFGGLSGASAVRMWKAAFLDNTANRARLERLECTHAGFRIDALARAQTVREWDAACLPAYGFDTMDAMFAHADPVAHFGALPASIHTVRLHHNISDGHVVHHLFFSQIPHYRLSQVRATTPTRRRRSRASLTRRHRPPRQSHLYCDAQGCTNMSTTRMAHPSSSHFGGRFSSATTRVGSGPSRRNTTP